jgi:hypothetical protein
VTYLTDGLRLDGSQYLEVNKLTLRRLEMSKEELFRRALGEALKEKLFIQEEKKEGKYEIHIENGRNLLYKVILDGNLEYRPKNPNNPKRGSLAFQTDLLISYRKNKRNIPIVAIETKFDSLSTHDILTYSAKAQKHKEIYPYLRYGLVIGKKGTFLIDFLFTIQDLILPMHLKLLKTPRNLILSN